MLRLLVAVLACASFLFAVDPEDHVRKSVPVSSATRLVLTADVGGLHIQPGTARTVDVDVYFRGFSPGRDYSLDVTEQGSDILVKGAFRKGWEPWLEFWPFFLGHGMRAVEYRVTVPENLNANLETSGGAIFVSNLKSQVHVHTSGGPIHIADVAGEVDASTSGGPISIERNSGRVRAHTSGGGIDVRDAVGAIDASTSGGGVTASLLGQPKEECRLTTSGGSITVRLSKDVHVDLDASTSGGRVWTDFPVQTSYDRHSFELRAPLNGGGPRLYLRTSGGGITVRGGPKLY